MRNLLLLCGMQFFISRLDRGILMPITAASLMYVLGASPTKMGITFYIDWGIATALAQIPRRKIVRPSWT